MTPDFTIITQKLILRLPDKSEAARFSELVSTSPSLYPWLDWAHPAFSHFDAEEFLLANRLNWIKEISYGFGVYQSDCNQLIGMVAITEFQHIANMASIGYWIGDDHQKLGYGKEALDALIEFCFAKLKLTRLEIVCDPDNKPSHLIAQKCGAVRECLAKNRFVFNGKPKDGLVFSVTP